MHNEARSREFPIARRSSSSSAKPSESPIVKPYRRYPRNSQPPYLYPPYRLTIPRAPRKPLIVLPQTLSEVTGPVFGHDDIHETDNDLTRQHEGEPLGERITVSGRVLDDNGRSVPNTLIELWQCNAAGRYRHRIDQHRAPLDPNFSGAGRTMTDGEGNYRFVTIKPGPYPWENHPNAWRPAHIHFSLYGTAFATRLVTQMYFPGDPLFPFDPIFNSVRDERARQRMIARFEINRTEPGWALAFRYDIVVRGRRPRHLSARSKASRRLEPTPWHTVGPYFGITVNGANSIGSIAPPNAKGERVKLVCAVFDRDGKRVPDTLIEIWQANAEGKYNHPADTQAKPIDPGFAGFGRQITNENGECKFETIKPGRVPGPRGTLQAPHLEVGVFTRGVMKHLVREFIFQVTPAMRNVLCSGWFRRRGERR